MLCLLVTPRSGHVSIRGGGLVSSVLVVEDSLTTLGERSRRVGSRLQASDDIACEVVGKMRGEAPTITANRSLGAPDSLRDASDRRDNNCANCFTLSTCRRRSCMRRRETNEARELRLAARPRHRAGDGSTGPQDGIRINRDRDAA